jgi:hypothetical protein
MGRPELCEAEWRSWISGGRVSNNAFHTFNVSNSFCSWWINTMFAYHDGIIANSSSNSGVTTCYTQAYALLLADGDELDCSDPAHFTYRSTRGDSRRYLLCAGTLASRRPIRVLRSHTLRSFFAPRAGVRYDGLYKVTGWRITQDSKTKAIHYDISFDRLPSEPPIGPVLEHPNMEELDDYREYKRIRKEIREHRNVLRHGLRFGAPDAVSSTTRDRMSIAKTNSDEIIKTTTSTVAKRRGSSLHIQSSAFDPRSDSQSPAKIEENPFFTTPSPDDNPFFSGGLASQTGLGKINTLRPDTIDYAPVLQAASAAGAAIDPFFAHALEEQAAKRANAFKLSSGPKTSPLSAKPRSLGLSGRKPMIGFISTIREADEQKDTSQVRRDSQSPMLSKS